MKGAKQSSHNMTWVPPVLFFASLFFQFCNVAEVVIIREMIKANLATNQKKKEVNRFEYIVCYPTGT
jgi:hypothetical protein